MQHIHEIVAKLISRITLLTRALNVRGSNTHMTLPQNLKAAKSHCYGGVKDAKELENFIFDME